MFACKPRAGATISGRLLRPAIDDRKETLDRWRAARIVVVRRKMDRIKRAQPGRGRASLPAPFPHPPSGGRAADDAGRWTPPTAGAVDGASAPPQPAGQAGSVESGGVSLRMLQPTAFGICKDGRW